MLGYVLGLEVAIIGATGLDAWARGPETTWLRRWFFWHLAPLWFFWLLGFRALRRAAQRTAHRAVLDHLHRPQPLALVERSTDSLTY